MQNITQLPLNEAGGARVRESVFNHFLLYFVMLIVGFPLSIYLEIISNPHAQSLEYWAETSSHQYYKSSGGAIYFPNKGVFQGEKLGQPDEAAKEDIAID